MAFPPRFLDDIRARVGLADQIARKVKLVRRGREHVGLCPFHNEKTPSFTVNEDKGFYHCFGCGAHGDVIGFVMRTDNLSFPEAVERLAADAGLEVPVTSPEERKREREAVSLYAVTESACAFFEAELKGARGKTARDYLARRGLDQDAIARFRIGYAPDTRGALKSALTGAGVQESLLVTTGLLVVPEDGRAAYDRFRGRVIFPIFDRRGRTIAFGGRILGDGEPKYLNSPDTPLFHKGDVLYGWSHALKGARETGLLAVTEGYMDVIALVSAGIAAMAPLGTALTESQITALWRVVPEPVLCFDGDAAGARAQARAAERALALLKPGVSLRFVTLPRGEDPDSLIRARGAAGMEGLMATARPLADVVWEMEIKGRPVDTPERRALIEKKLMDRVFAIADRGVQDHYRRHFKARLWDAFSDFSPSAGARRRRPESRTRLRGDPLAGTEEGRADARERVLVATVLNHPDLLADVAEEFAGAEIGNFDLNSLRQAILDAAGSDGPDAAELRERLDARGFAGLTARLSGARARLIDWFAAPDAARDDALTGFRQVLGLHRRFGTLQAELTAGESALAGDMTEAQWRRFQSLKVETEAQGGGEADIEDFGVASGRRRGL